MKPRRRNDWKPKPEPKSQLCLLPNQVKKPELQCFSMNALQQKVMGLKVPSFHFAVCFAEQHTVGFSQSSLIHLVGPLDCTLHNYVHGGQSCPLGLFSSPLLSCFQEYQSPFAILTYSESTNEYGVLISLPFSYTLLAKRCQPSSRCFFYSFIVMPVHFALDQMG